MGSFFANLQVRTPDLLAVAALLDADASKAGMRPATVAEKPDRSVALVPGGGWVSVYDDADESQDDKALDKRTQAVSKQLDVTAFWVLVHDSDVLLLGLHERGTKKDRYDSDPTYFGGK